MQAEGFGVSVRVSQWKSSAYSLQLVHRQPASAKLREIGGSGRHEKETQMSRQSALYMLQR